MLRPLTILALFALLFASSLAAQEPAAPDAAQPMPAEEAGLDAISQEAAALEAQLGKLTDTTPEAAELMLKLLDLYHREGRVFGLIRIGESFVAKHPSHAKHSEAMLKLIDGLQALSRNKELSAASRQFLTRYPNDPQCARLEQTLAKTVEQLNDPVRAAEAYQAVWKRQGASPVGREAGVSAITLYLQANTKESFMAAGTLADEMLAALPAGEFAANVGWQGFQAWRRAGEWAKANTTGAALLARGYGDPAFSRVQLHSWMAEHWANLGQRANAVESYRQVRALSDTRETHERLIQEMHNASLTPGEMEPVVNEYAQKYPDQPQRHAYRSYVAQAYLRAMDAPRALAILAEVLPFDAMTNSNASQFVSQYATAHGNEAAQWAQIEQVLRGALNQNPAHAHYLRYVLAADLYRDRMQAPDRARQMFKELIVHSPSGDGYTRGALFWLLYNPASPEDFQDTVAQWLKTRAKLYHSRDARDWLAQWIAEASQNEMHKANAALVQPQLDAANNDPLYQEWLAVDNPDTNVSMPARARLLEPARFASLSDEQAKLLSMSLGEYYRHQSAVENRPKAAEIYGQLARRFPKEWQPAYYYLLSASDNLLPEAAKPAIQHMVTIEPIANNGDVWLRMVRVADTADDVNLLNQVVGWILKSHQKYGFDAYALETIGDVYAKRELPQQANDAWRRALTGDPNSSSYYQSASRLVTLLEGAPRAQLIQELLAKPSDFHGAYASWLAADYLKAGDLANFEAVLAASRKRQDERPFHPWGLDEYPGQTWLDQYRTSMEVKDEDRRRLYTALRDLRIHRLSAAAQLALLELEKPETVTPMGRLLAYQATTTVVGDQANDWDRLVVYGQAAMTRRDYPAVATLVTGLLANVPNIDPARRQAGRDMVAQSYARMGGVGLSIDESSPIAPLMQAALYLRLGDERLALESYSANAALFDEHRGELPVDLILFVCENLIAAGGDENLERAEDTLRSWLLKNSELKEVDDTTKADVQLLLAKSYFKAQRFDVARSEFTTVINRYPTTPQRTDAEFGIGESFMAQKVYDQAETVFERLATSQQRDVVIRAEFLRGVLANRRGDRDEARDIFRAVLERVPSIELANQALFNLAEVYGAEERYMDQLELLRTVGRLGRASKRWHAPGTALSIVVQDSDLGISRGHSRIPVRVVTEPGGDEELVYLYSGGAGKGLFRADLDTQLGTAAKGNKTLELTGNDTIRCDYPDEFKAEFRSVPLSDADIRIAANADMRLSGSKIIDEDEETFSQRLEREARERESGDKRLSQNRPANQIKPGNPIYVRIEDADRSLSNQPDKLLVKLVATSGDQVQLELTETGPHTGIFEGVAASGELPAGALASDTAIDHSPLMAIDTDTNSFWLSEPDGATPKWLSLDMKDLKSVRSVRFSTPQATQHAPIRGQLQGSHDGRFWFPIGGVPTDEPAELLAEAYGPMTVSVYPGNYLGYTEWKQIVEMTKTAKPTETGPVETLQWSRLADAADAQQPFALVWHGKFLQRRAGAVRLAVQGIRTALLLDGRLEMPLGEGNRTIDVWLEPGTHDLTVFSALQAGAQGAGVTWAHADQVRGEQFAMVPFRTADLDLDDPLAKQAAKLREPATVEAVEGAWTFNFAPLDLRHLRLMIREYSGEAVAINHVEVWGEGDAKHIPTENDVLALATNEVLEIAAGDTITATYVDELTQSNAGSTQLLTADLSATYFDAAVYSIGYDFTRLPNGQVVENRKQTMRIDPGERFILEVTDYDRDQTAQKDTLDFEVIVNDGEPVKLTALETREFTGVFTKEVDTTLEPDGKKLVVKPGDRIVCRYLDEQNTFPGHAVPRETVVYASEPTPARVRIVETRVMPSNSPRLAPPETVYLPASAKKPVNNVAFEAPLTVEVIDRDAAKDSRSHVIVQLKTTSGATIDLKCVISNAMEPNPSGDQVQQALEDGRFVGQIVMQLGGKDSPNVVPLTASMPRGLLGGAAQIKGTENLDETLILGVLNVGGQDVIQAAYNDELRPDGKPKLLGSKGRLIANGTLACTDRDYEKDVTKLHVGEKIFLKVTDADADVSDARDSVTVVVTGDLGEKETVTLEETLVHSGVFTGSFTLKPSDKQTADNFTSAVAGIETYFGDLLSVSYVDKNASTESGTLTAKQQVPVVIGTDGLVNAFSKSFGDETLAVETQFHVAESYFELFKSHKKLGRKDEQLADLEAGRRILREVMQDYPNPKYVPRIAYLLGQFSQELGQYDEAITSYQTIVRQFPDSTLAADAQYKLAQCYEDSGDFDNALEAYVTLAATYPKSPLIANVMIRISDHFYKKEDFVISAQVGEKFLERFEGHEWSPRMAFRIGQCYYKGKQYTDASEAFDRFSKVFPDDALCADALFWSGESFRMAGQTREAFRRYNRCHWDFPSSDSAKYARGRLALPEMLQQYESEANDVDQ